jgi:hypothetical protein
MSIRPQDLPEIRAELFDNNASSNGTEYWDEHAQLPYYRDIIKTTSRDLQDTVAAALKGDLYFVSAPMATLAATAGQSLPIFGMQPEDLPSPHGVLLFERTPPLLHGPDADDKSVNVNGAAWTSVDGGFWIIPIAQECAHLRPTLGGPVILPFCAEGDMPPFTRDKVLMDHLITTVRSSWLLMQQPLSENTETQPDRATRKRLRRAGHEPAPVRVIELRRPKTTSSHGDSDREYHHQWIVRGHWRNHWHPKRQVHRPVWIAPHVKGPEGAPLIGGEKVYALKR